MQAIVGALRGNAVWLTMLAAGIGLGVTVLASWPEPTVKVVRLPYGEAQPKTPPETAASSVKKAKRAEAPASVSVWEPASIATPEDEAGRVLAFVEPSVSDDAGPAPVPSELDLDAAYVQESPEELGAEPLPGAVLTPPVAR